MADLQSYLLPLLTAVAPVVGSRGINATDKTTWEFDYAEGATQDQITAAQAVVSSFSLANWAINAPIYDQVDALEATMTMRRIREAITGKDNGWMANLETQIEGLRAQLQPLTT